MEDGPCPKQRKKEQKQTLLLKVLKNFLTFKEQDVTFKTA